MHPGVMARRRAVAEERLRTALQAIGERMGTEPVETPSIGTSDAAVRGLFVLENMADFAERLAGIDPDAELAKPEDMTADAVVTARVKEAVPAVKDDVMAAVLVEFNRVPDEGQELEPLRDRILAIKGVGPATADKIETAITESGVRPATGDLPGPVVGEGEDAE